MNEPQLVLKDIHRTYRQGAERLEILRGAELQIDGGEVVALVAPSGAGKSTLLHVAGLLEPPDGGDVIICGRSCGKMRDNERTGVRSSDLGFVYQFHHLLPEFSALENVALPQIIAGEGRSVAQKRANQLLASLGLSMRAHHRPARLSGGEQQRVAIARALVNQPKILLADEPTGNLDHRTADLVFAEMLKLVREKKIAALIATHNPMLAAQMDRVVTLEEGRLVPFLLPSHN